MHIIQPKDSNVEYKHQTKAWQKAFILLYQNYVMWKKKIMQYKNQPVRGKKFLKFLLKLKYGLS